MCGTGREDQPNNKQLVAYLVTGQVDAATSVEHLEQSQRLYEDSYAQASPETDLRFDIKGWNSSYTGQPIPNIEMAEWVDATVADIRHLHPQRVLEIGCGTGLLLARLAPDCVEIWGTDYSQQVIHQVERLRSAEPSLGDVHLSHRIADDFSGIPAGNFDCVVLNSIVQYFPNVDYLLQVLVGAIRTIRPGGAIYVGDVRNLQLLPAYHAAIQLHQAADDLPLDQLQAQIQQRLRDEEELLIDPDFFYALPQRFPGISSVDIHLKRGACHNELTQFRYQVVLHLEQASDGQERPTTGEHSAWHELHWGDGVGTTDTLIQQLQRQMQLQPNPAMVVRGIPNRRVHACVQALDKLREAEPRPGRLVTVAHLRDQLAVQATAVDPESLWALSTALPFAVHVTWARCPVWSMPSSSPTPIMRRLPPMLAWLNLPADRCRPPSTGAPTPIIHFSGKLSRTLAPALRTWLHDKLPDYMTPAAFVLLEALPLTPNGKIDRKALPAPDISALARQGEFITPRTPTEIAVAAIWAEVLGIDPIGIHDNFFALGGHSLLATQVVSRLRQALNVEIALRDLFETPTVAGLAAQIDALHQVNGAAAAVEIPAADRSLPLALSHAQERLWFLDQLDGNHSAYNIPAALRLRGTLDIAALEHTLHEIVRRHEVLRTVFVMQDGDPVQQIQAARHRADGHRPERA